MLSKSDILKADDISTETVSVPEWGGHVFVRGLNGAERDDYEQRAMDRQKGDKECMKLWRARIVASTVVDETGENLFGPRDVDALGLKNANVLDRIVSKALELSGLVDEESAEEN